MAKTLTSNNIPVHSSLNDIAPDAAWLDGYSVESLDAFIKANAGDVSYGLDAGQMYTWLLVKPEPKDSYTKEDGTVVPARFVLHWQETKTGFKSTSNVYMTADAIEDWLDKVYRRTSGHVMDNLPKRTKLGLLDAFNWLSEHPITLAYDYVNDSPKPYITFKWISPNTPEHGRNRIPA